MTLLLKPGNARAISAMLERLAELPSTPDIMQAGARERVRAVEDKLPSPHQRQSWDRDRPAGADIELEDETAISIVELLDMLAMLPSTPPPLADDARRQARELAAALGPKHP